MSGQVLQMPVESDIAVAKPENANERVLPYASVTFGEVAHLYIAMKESKWGAHAAITAKSIICKHLVGAVGNKRVSAMTGAEIQTLISSMVSNNASQSLLKKATTHLRAILDLAQELNVIISNPMRSHTFELDRKSRKQKSERYLSLDECRALLAELSGRDRLIVRLFLQLGVRPEELFALRRDDVHEEFIRIDEVFALGQVKEAYPDGHATDVYVPPGLRDELRAWMTSTSGREEDWLFPSTSSRRATNMSPIRPATFRNGILQPAAIRAGIAGVDMLTLRRTCAVHFGKKASAEDAQAQMRLSTPLSTFRDSQERSPDSLKSVAGAIEAEMFPKDEPHSAPEETQVAPTFLRTLSNPLRRFFSLLA